MKATTKTKTKAKTTNKSPKKAAKTAKPASSPRKKTASKRAVPVTKPHVAKPKAHKHVPGAMLTAQKWPKWAQAVGWFLPVAAVAVVIALYSGTNKPQEQYTVVHTSARLATLSQEASTMNLGDRIAFWSENLLKNPTLLEPLGRGPTIDDTAAVFPSNYDCTTYVETVGALARAQSFTDLAKEVIKIRYAGDVVSFDTRNHFPEADWIPNNSARGIVKDITAEIATKSGVTVGYVTKTINRGAWLASHKERPATRAIAAENAAVKEAKVGYIPIEKIDAALASIPQGAVVNIVRSNRPKFPVLISHQGFVIWKDGVAYFRNASRDRDIRDIPFATYVKQMRSLPWRVVGFNINAYQG